MGLPWLLAFALRNEGWTLRSDIIWNKSNCMPESVRDRPTRAHEYLFLLSKKRRYYYDADAIMEPASFQLETKGWSIAGSSDAFGQRQSRRRSKENAKTFRGGGTYTLDRSFSNQAAAERGSHGNQSNVSGLRNKRSVWTVATSKAKDAHFATFPEQLITPCILAGSRRGDTVLDPFLGTGTTASVALTYGRHFIGIELNPQYVEMARKRLANVQVKGLDWEID